MDAKSERLEVDCCVVGGGPAGMMLGFLLARAGVKVAVLEKHGDFLRDFRGDTVHPSTLEVMNELGIIDEFLARPHQKAHQLTAWVGEEMFTVADFSHLPVRCPYIALMPQWDFLDFLAAKARTYPGFDLRMNCVARELIRENGKVVGVIAETPTGSIEIRTPLTIGADGRHSTIRAAANLTSENIGAPMDVLWFRLSRQGDDPSQALGRFDKGKIFIMIDRGDYWQCGFVIPKGTWEALKGAGLDSFRGNIAALAPFLSNRIEEISSWEAVKLLTVSVERLTTWYIPGLLCIGDAAHTMSPVGGVGINLAVQDAVATANLLADKLRAHTVDDADLAGVQQRRAFPVKFTQRLQVLVQNRVIRRVLDSGGESLKPPLPLKLLGRWPVLRRIPARVIGLGIRPEHVRSKPFEELR